MSKQLFFNLYQALCDMNNTKTKLTQILLSLISACMIGTSMCPAMSEESAQAQEAEIQKMNDKYNQGGYYDDGFRAEITAIISQEQYKHLSVVHIVELAIVLVRQYIGPYTDPLGAVLVRGFLQKAADALVEDPEAYTRLFSANRFR